jgi:gas vesicle protein
MKKSSIIIYSLIASAAGVAIGILFAPQKGSQTRKQISEKNHQYSDYLADKYNEFIDSVSHPLESIEEETKRLARKANENVKKAASEVRSVMH